MKLPDISIKEKITKFNFKLLAYSLSNKLLKKPVVALFQPKMKKQRYINHNSNYD